MTPTIKVRPLPERPIKLEDLPPLVPRDLAAAVALLTVRTMARNENVPDGLGLTPIKRGKQRVYYERGAFLKWLGLPAPEPVETQPAKSPRNRKLSKGKESRKNA